VRKKLFVSAGLLAVGTAGLQAAYAPDAGADASKAWDVSATLRGFYDDNYITSTRKQDSMGFEVNPSFNLTMPLQQTEIGLKYTYGLYYYQKREELGQNPIDQTHQFDLWLDHAFSTRWEARLSDSVVVAQEPALLTPGAVVTAQRATGNNIVNTATIGVNTVWTRLFSTAFNYQNSFASYENSGATITPLQLYQTSIGLVIGPGVTPSLAGLLDRVSQSASLDLQWQVGKETVALVGYQIGLVNFTGNEPIAFNPVTGTFYYSDSRDSLSHVGYVGAQHMFAENLTGSAKVGAQYMTYYNDPSSTSSLGPYLDASLVYTYTAGGYMQLGAMETRNATDTVQIDSSGHITQDQESTVVYGSINHPLTPKLMASAVGHFQYSTFHDGLHNNQSSQFYNLGLNLAYTFNRHISTDIGYNFDYYTTPVSSGNYTRNRLYLGITATY
jgi:hypothetical protein